MGSLIASARRISDHARPTATPAPARPRTTPSLSICRINWARLAPIASRTLISRRRAEARARSIPATLAHAISRTRPTTAMTAAEPAESGPVACGTSSRTSLVANADIVRARFVSGYAAASCVPSVAMLACAWWTVAPGLRRPFTNSQRLPRRSIRVRPVGTE